MSTTSTPWEKDLPQAPVFSETSLRVRTAIIGGGITGLSTAYHLLKENPGEEVVVLEAGEIGSGATSRSTGMVTPGIGQNIGAFIKRVGIEHARELYLATLEAVEYVKQLTEEESMECDFSMCGQLVLAYGKEGIARLQSQKSYLQKLELPHEIISGSELSDYVNFPLLMGKSGNDSMALRLPVAGTFNPGKFVNQLCRATERLGAKIYSNARVTDLNYETPVVISLENNRRVIADRVILTVSGYINQLGLMKGRVLPVRLNALESRPLTEIELKKLGWRQREGIIDSRRLFSYFRLTSRNSVVFGGARPLYETGANFESAKSGDHEEVKKDFTDFFPGLDVERSWSGLIGYTVDNMPVIRTLPNRPAVTYVGGWCGHGNALGISLGAGVAKLLKGERLPQVWSKLRVNPPYIPLEMARRFAFTNIVSIMSILDRRGVYS